MKQRWYTTQCWRIKSSKGSKKAPTTSHKHYTVVQSFPEEVDRIGSRDVKRRNKKKVQKCARHFQALGSFQSKVGIAEAMAMIGAWAGQGMWNKVFLIQIKVSKSFSNATWKRLRRKSDGQAANIGGESKRRCRLGWGRMVPKDIRKKRQ